MVVRKIPRLLFIVLLSSLIVCCSERKETKLQKYELNGRIQGTYYHIVYYHLSEKDCEKRNLITPKQIEKAIDSIFTVVDNSLSLWNPNSLLNKLNHNMTNKVDKVFKDNYMQAKHISDMTNGMLDITIGALVRAYGFAYEERRELSDREIDSMMMYVGYEKLKLKEDTLYKSYPQTQMDFNAVAQGYTTDQISDFLKKHNISSHIVDVGGEVYASGLKPDGQNWRVAVEQPSDSMSSERVFNTLIKLKNQSIVTSGNYRKFYVEKGIKYSHTINPKTGRCAKNTLLSASVVAHTAVMADGLATACMVMGLDETKKFLEKHPQYAAILIYSDEKGDLKTYVSPTLEDKIEKVN